MRRSVAFAALAAATAITAAAASAHESDEVTLRVRIVNDAATSARHIEIDGTVPSRVSGDRVDVQAKECGFGHFYRLVGGTTTGAAGSWRVSTERGDLTHAPINSYFRARWRDRFSRPVLVRTPAIVDVRWNARLRVARAAVDPWLTGLSFHGRSIELQRRVRGTDQWVLVRRARLVRAPRTGRRLPPGFASVFAARFVVPTRGLELRVRVPDTTGAPCFSAAVSQTWRS